MNKKTKSSYLCSACGETFPKWQGKCTSCGAWESITEFREAASSKRERQLMAVASSAPIPLSEARPQDVIRAKTGFPEVDRVLGGGLVPGSMVLVGGAPGIGKSTIMLQIAACFADTERQVLYISGEESIEQISLRAERLGLATADLHLLTETSAEAATAAITAFRPALAIVDSIQTLFSEELDSAPGSVGQVRECAAMLLRMCKEKRITVFLIGHVTKDGAIAGPRVLEHMVDTVLYFEGDATYQYRLLRAVKNRFGPSGEIAVLAMGDSGLSEVKNASEFFLSGGSPQVGTAVAGLLEGTRVLAVELQALCNPAHFGMPQRVANGMNPKRLALILAVIERYAGLSLGDHDVFFNITGGLSVNEPAADLATAAAILSSHRNLPLRTGLAVIGEIGLGGEVRQVGSMPNRLKELAGLGFRECIVPEPGKNAEWARREYGMKLISCPHIRDLADVLF